MTDEERTQDLPETQASVGSDADMTAAAEASESAAEAQGVASPAAALEARIAELEREVAREREAATDYMQRLQRAQADFSNYKRRAQQDEQQREALAIWRAMAGVLPALDSLERAFATLPPSLRSYSWIDGVALVHMQMERALATLGLAPVAAAPGAAFDPTRHEAIGEVETSEHPDGTIAVVVQRGYEAGNVLLRPALVQVARASRTQPPSQPVATEFATEATTPAAPGVSGEDSSDISSSSEASASGA